MMHFLNSFVPVLSFLVFAAAGAYLGVAYPTLGAACAALIVVRFAYLVGKWIAVKIHNHRREGIDEMEDSEPFDHDW